MEVFSEDDSDCQCVFADPQMAQIDDMFAHLCTRTEGTFTVSDDCLEKLEEILARIETEDSLLHTYRRAIGFGQNIKKDLLPLLLHVKDDGELSTRIIDTIVKILIHLTIPVEYLLPAESSTRTDVGRHTVFELNKLLLTSKEAFADCKSTKVIMDHIKFFVESDLEVNFQYCESINNCLVLLRNVLHIAEAKNTPTSTTSLQNHIIWNLFTQSVDKILIYLISCPQKMLWGVSVVQVITLLYKDQHVGTLQKLLNLWLETSLSDSSDDNESNTSPPDQGSDDSSPIITSDPTSESSDGGEKQAVTSTSTIERNKKMNYRDGEVFRVPNSNFDEISSTKSRKDSVGNLSTKRSNFANTSRNNNNSNGKKDCMSSQSEDFGYVTQVENQESISTSSNEEDQPQRKHSHPKSHGFQKNRYSSKSNRTTSTLDKKELRRKKLVKRSKTNAINMKGLMHHLPTDEDIANILKEFTVDFLLKGYGSLVNDLYTQLLTHIPMDTSHFFWLVTYFLKFATQLELDLEHVNLVLCPKILSFLVFEAVWIYEELEVSQRVRGTLDLNPALRRLHLVITALREFLQAVDAYQKMIHISEADRCYLLELQTVIMEMEDLRLLFLLLLRQYNPKIQAKQYLQDLILTNHNYLLFLDNNARKKERSFDIMEHLKQFATVEIMGQYGLLLENFKENGEIVNNCIFTMMHHIGGDLDNVATLFQPSILKTFSQIWEMDYGICDDWSDLIEFIINKFINTPRPLESGDNEGLKWTDEDKGHLLEYYNQSRNSNDTIAKITQKYLKSGAEHKTQASIIGQLLKQRIINESQYNDFIKCNKPVTDDKKLNDANFLLHVEDTSVDDGIKVLKEHLYGEDKFESVMWLQKVLIETCYVKLVLANPNKFKHDEALQHSVIYYFCILRLPVPVVPWTADQTAILKYQPFVLLLHKLGLYLPIDTGKNFVTIPNFWNAEHIFNVAQQLGPIDSGKLKFDVGVFKDIKHDDAVSQEMYGITDTFKEWKLFLNDKQAPIMVRYTPLPNSQEWYQLKNFSPRVLSVVDFKPHIPSVDQVSVTPPCHKNFSCFLTPPDQNIAPNRTIKSNDINHGDNHMEYLPIIQDDNDRNSIDTASIASDLTRMCVSDEEDKLILVLDKK